MLLVATNKTDLASDFLILRLKERDIPFVRLNTEDYGKRFHIDIELTDVADFRIEFDNGEILSKATVSAVYLRQPRAPDVSNDIAPTDKTFAQRELKEGLRSLWRVIDREKWLNHPCNLWLASNKIEQLQIAHQVGLLIPETCVTSSKKTVCDFYERHNGRIICKAVKHGFSQSDNTVTLATTKRVKPEFLEEFDKYAVVPMILQREISKACDIRVTVVGARVFATAIYSQDHAETEVDWRVWDVNSFDLHHEPINLPAEVETACRRITSHYGLNYAAIDFALDTTGQYYFFELNPNGQWAWIEKKAGYPIRDAMIDCLSVEDTAYG